MIVALIHNGGRLFISPLAAADCSPTVYPLYPIGIVNKENSEGVADSIATDCALEGIVYGINFNPPNIQFTLIDEQGEGIGVFNNSQNFGYTVTEGDRVRVEGRVNQFMGLTQVDPVSITVINTGNPLLDPEEVGDLGEDTESNLVVLRGFEFVDPTAWSPGSGAGFNMDITDGLVTLTMRIDNATDLFNETNPPSFPTFDVVGLGGQFDSDDPLLDSYQILPRYSSDITSSSVSVDFPSAVMSVKVIPTIFQDHLNIESEAELTKLKMFSADGKLLIEREVTGKLYRFETSELGAGMYHLIISTGNSRSIHKIIKQ